jgi:hypothetical protein
MKISSKAAPATTTMSRRATETANQGIVVGSLCLGDDHRGEGDGENGGEWDEEAAEDAFVGRRGD